MDDYIKREDALNARFPDCIDHDGLVYVPMKDVVNHLKKLPAGDVRENIHGHWDTDEIEVGGINGETQIQKIPICNVCEVHNEWFANFCPNCGAYMGKRTLGDATPGETVKIGDREYIVLGHGAETTAVIAKKFTKSMKFGEFGDYEKSAVREYCNGEFYNELAKAVGEENIVKHTVNLMGDDGTGKGKKVKDNVSILTTDLYRRYREFLPAYGNWWWTATRVTYADSDYARYVCYVGSSGILLWGGCFYSGGVRPFCILNSSVLIF